MEAANKKTWPKRVLLAPIFSTSICLFLMIISAFYPSWSTLSQNEISYQFSLFSCQNCEPMYSGWSWQCFSNVCDSDDTIGDCQTYSKSMNSSYAYFVLEAFSFITGLILIEKLILLMDGKMQSKNTIFYLQSFIMAASHMIAISAWLNLNEADFISYKPLVDADDVSLQSETGPEIAKINCLMCILSFILLVTVLHRQPTLKSIESSTDMQMNFRKYKFDYWMWIVGFLFASGVVTIIIALSNRWVLRNSDSSLWEGGLSNCYNCEKDFSYISWGCLSSFYCSIDSSAGTCNLYKHLSKAYEAYVVIECLGLISSIFFLKTYFHLINKRDYGLSAMNYCWAICIAMFNFTATVIWFNQSKAKLAKTCDSPADIHEEPAICSSYGPYTILISNAFFIPMAIIFCFAYYKRTDESRQVMLAETQQKQSDSFSDKGGNN
ncbi:unnamed protein product [Blepharisma stoltei]|uniref:Uncharacterized protein n=1 Tax=Blepharisma stoltei TaxID=1481888 RepID=A0AAU9JF77_9CILI|nr:unnamed protein product [Blepharisma stoltei]